MSVSRNIGILAAASVAVLAGSGAIKPIVEYLQNKTHSSAAEPQG